jgi:hypothetical protein
LVIEIHIRLTTLRRLDSLARPKDLIKQSVLLLTPIRITSLHFQRLLGTCSVSLLVIADIGVALKHLVLVILILFFLILDHIQFGIILCEVVLLCLHLTEVRIELMLLHTSMLVTLGGVETRLIDNLCCIKAFPSRVNILGSAFLFPSRRIIQDLFNCLIQLKRVVLGVLQFL